MLSSVQSVTMDLFKGVLALASVYLSISQMRATSEKRLITMLLENYKQNGIEGRPVINTTRSISIGVGFSLLQILDFNQDKQSISFVGWISLKWQDSLLRWNAHEFDSIRQVALHPDQIWTPDVVLFNAISPPKTIHGTKLLVTQKGEVLWVSQVQYDMTCATAPYQDETECEMKFGSWTLNTDMLQMSTSSVQFDMAHYVPHSHWDVIRTFATTSQFEYPYCPGVRYTRVSYVFALVRRLHENVVRYHQEVPMKNAADVVNGSFKNESRLGTFNYAAVIWVAFVCFTVN